MEIPRVQLFEANRQYGADLNFQPAQLSTNNLPMEDTGPEEARARYNRQMQQQLINTGFQLAQNMVEVGERVGVERAKRRAMNGDPENDKSEEEIMALVNGAMTTERDEHNNRVPDIGSIASAIDSFADLDIALAAIDPSYHMDLIDASQDRIREQAMERAGILGRARFQSWFDGEALPEYRTKTAVNAAVQSARIRNEEAMQEVRWGIDNGHFTHVMNVADAAVESGLWSVQEHATIVSEAMQLAPINRNLSEYRRILETDGLDAADAFFEKIRSQQIQSLDEMPSLQAIRTGEQTYNPERMTPAQFADFQAEADGVTNEYIRRERSRAFAEMENAAIQLEEYLTNDPAALTRALVRNAGFLDHDPRIVGDRGRVLHNQYMNRIAVEESSADVNYPTDNTIENEYLDWWHEDINSGNFTKEVLAEKLLEWSQSESNSFTLFDTEGNPVTNPDGTELTYSIPQRKITELITSLDSKFAANDYFGEQIHQFDEQISTHPLFDGLSGDVRDRTVRRAQTMFREQLNTLLERDRLSPNEIWDQAGQLATNVARAVSADVLPTFDPQAAVRQYLSTGVLDFGFLESQRKAAFEFASIVQGESQVKERVQTPDGEEKRSFTVTGFGLRTIEPEDANNYVDFQAQLAERDTGLTPNRDFSVMQQDDLQPILRTQLRSLGGLTVDQINDALRQAGIDPNTTPAIRITDRDGITMDFGYRKVDNDFVMHFKLENAGWIPVTNVPLLEEALYGDIE